MKEEVTPLDLGEGSLNLIPSSTAPHPFFDEEPNKEAGRIPTLTPIMETVDGFRSINWKQVMQQMRAGLNNVGVVIAVVSEKTHQLGCYLAEV